MTNIEIADLHRRVSEHLEKKPDEPIKSPAHMSYTYERYSPKGAWQWRPNHWEPLEWTRDKNAVRLLKMMPKPSLEKRVGWYCVPDPRQDDNDEPICRAYAEHVDLGTAIVLAFLSWFETLSEEEKEKVRRAI